MPKKCETCGQMIYEPGEKRDYPPFTGTWMPFGKHKGKKFGDIPRDYLDWAVENLRDEGIKTAIRKWMDVNPAGEKPKEEMAVDEQIQQFDENNPPF